MKISYILSCSLCICFPLSSPLGPRPHGSAPSLDEKGFRTLRESLVYSVLHRQAPLLYFIYECYSHGGHGDAETGEGTVGKKAFPA